LLRVKAVVSSHTAHDLVITEFNRNLNSWLAARHIPSELDKAAKLELIESLRDRRAVFYRQLAKQHFLQHVGEDLYFQVLSVTNL